MGKHVIFLGAGASHVSGYPLANGLRLLISSRKNWGEALEKYEVNHGLSGGSIRNLGCAFWDRHSEALQLFRNGGFGTLDEFCKLAGGFEFQDQINGLRGLVRAALGLFNPEDNFEKSEYYSFIQSLFEDDLMSLREDIAVLTYNYDSYLEFLLHRALEQRFQVSRKGKPPMLSEDETRRIAVHQRRLNSVTSGFNLLDNKDWLNEPGFCVLKLHGATGGPHDTVASYEVLFSASGKDRAETLLDPKSLRIMPPIFFPWEIMGDKGIQNEKSIFHSIWERARREVLAASKISFVGLSMHSYLFDGLKHLFEGKEGVVEIVVANTDNTPFVPGRTETHHINIPHSPGYAVSEVLGKIAPKMSREGIPAGRHKSAGDITLVKDFAQFVKTQMTPAVK